MRRRRAISRGGLPTGGGFALIVWGGGSPESLIDTAQSQGCAATSEWIAFDGKLIGYIHGAPDLVNNEFRGHFSGGSIPAGTALVLVCSAGGGPGSPAPLAAAPAPPPPPPPTPPPPPAALSLDQQFGVTAFDAINNSRKAAGLPALNQNTQLRAAAEKYVHLLNTSGQLNHGLDGQPWDRAQREGYPSGVVGEVIASAATSEALNVPHDTNVLMQAWLNSPPHRSIIMGDEFAFSDLGVGCAVGRNSGGLNLVMCVAMMGVP